MAIRTTVTRGYGNGTFNGTIPLVVTRGYAQGVAVAPDPFVPAPTVQDTEEDSTLLTLINQSALKFLEVVGCKNGYPFPMRPVLTQDEFVDLLTVSRGLAQNHYEGWFISRDSIRDPLEWGETQYLQTFRMSIEGLAWHESFHESRLYIQERTEELLRTIERNKDFGIGAGIEVQGLAAQFRFAPEAETSMYQTKITFELKVPRKEPSGRNTS